MWKRSLYRVPLHRCGLFIEAELGSRATDFAHLWETIARKILGEDFVNNEKAREEGAWIDEAFVLGFIINTRTMEISGPPAKVLGAADSTLSDEFQNTNL